ncbi:MAG TPA: hypothetical protein DIU35_08000 [Candidatus Latescibacteria bacterium]|nr:hypothetical protein [Gemmatimonadota bacterium]HCR17411.1 hypothetical protein [Candidatus Latescibacterota bacterium]
MTARDDVLPNDRSWRGLGCLIQGRMAVPVSEFTLRYLELECMNAAHLPGICDRCIGIVVGRQNEINTVNTKDNACFGRVFLLKLEVATVSFLRGFQVTYFERDAVHTLQANHWFLQIS